MSLSSLSPTVPTGVGLTGKPGAHSPSLILIWIVFQTRLPSTLLDFKLEWPHYSTYSLRLFPSPKYSTKSVRMADPFSTVAAAVGLVPIALHLGLQLFNAISKLKRISAELRRLRHDLEGLVRIISQIQGFCETHEEFGHFGGTHLFFHTIENPLSSFVEDVTELQSIVRKPSDKGETGMNRFGMKVKSVLNERKIMELSSRLTGHKATLQLALQVVQG